MAECSKSRFMRRKQVENELSINRNTLASIVRNDATFPAFFKLGAGITVIYREEFEQWVREKSAQASKNRQTCAGLSIKTL